MQPLSLIFRRALRVVSVFAGCALWVTLVGAQTATPTSLSLVTSGTPVLIGSNVTFTAVVSATGGVANGPVAFYADGVVLGTGTLDNTGTATLTTGALTAGNHAITATYSGNGNFGGSNGALTEVVTSPVGTFTVAATPQAPLIRGAGKTVFQITVTSSNGFAGPVALACGGLPADASCTFAQSPVTLAANGTVTTTMTTTTTVADATARLEWPNRDRLRLAPMVPTQAQPGPGGVALAALLPLQLSGAGLAAAGLRRRRYGLVLVMASLAVLGLSGCGCPTNAFHVYPITVTGTSTLGGPAQSSVVVYLYVAQSGS